MSVSQNERQSNEKTKSPTTPVPIWHGWGWAKRNREALKRLPDLPGFSRTIYRYLLQCVDNRASRQWADSYEAIAARIGFSRRTVRRYMPALV